MKLHSNSIPSIFTNAQLVAPPGFSIDRIAEAVGNQIAKTIIHEAAHGKEWATQYYTYQKQLGEMNRGEEESIAEQAEGRAGLGTDLGQDIYDESETTDQLDNREMLRRAIDIANRNNEFHIPSDAVEDANLGQSAWGQFEMVQGPEVQPQRQVSESNPNIAWNEQNRKLQVDVSSIVNEYNASIQNLGQPQPATHQDDGISPDVPGVSQQLPETSSDAVPAAGARPAR